MIYLRELKESDAPNMLEWMHDPQIQKAFKKNMLDKTLKEAESFCKNSPIPEQILNGQSLNFAIANDTDEYLGTISLKEIDTINRSAEYAIVTRQKAHGRGIAFQATGLLLKKAFQEYGLHRIYLNVLSDNSIAIRFYEKCGFKFEGEFKDHLLINGKYFNLNWYAMLEYDFNESFFHVAV